MFNTYLCYISNHYKMYSHVLILGIYVIIFDFDIITNRM